MIFFLLSSFKKILYCTFIYPSSSYKWNIEIKPCPYYLQARGTFHCTLPRENTA